MSRRSRVLRRILLLALAVYLVCSIAAVQVMNAALFGRADEPDGLTVRYADVAADYPRQTVTFSSGSAQLTAGSIRRRMRQPLSSSPTDWARTRRHTCRRRCILWTKDTAF